MPLPHLQPSSIKINESINNDPEMHYKWSMSIISIISSLLFLWLPICYHLATIYHRQNHYERSLSNMTTKGFNNSSINKIVQIPWNIVLWWTLKDFAIMLYRKMFVSNDRGCWHSPRQLFFRKSVIAKNTDNLCIRPQV